MTRNLKVGLEWNANVGEVAPVANWRVLPETRTRPALIVGTSTDRIGTPDGRLYSMTVSKSLHHETGLPVAPYAGVSRSTSEDRFLFPFGVNVRLADAWSALFLYDGVHSHLAATYAFRRYNLTLLAIERRDLGFTVGIAF